MDLTRVEMRPDGVALLIMDQPGRPVNTLAAPLLGDLAARLDRLAADPGVLAVVLASAKASGFVAGADLKALQQTQSAEQATESLRATGRVLDRMAAFGKPLVAAVHGAVLGGGLGLAMNCRRIVAADSPDVVFGYPAVRFGFIPAGGIPGKLVERVGLAQALPLLITAQNINAAQALAIGLIDAVVPADGLLAAAVADALALAQGRLAPPPVHAEPLDPELIAAARQGVMARTRGLLAAPLAVLEGLETAVGQGPEAGRQREDELFGQLVAGPQARNLIWHFGAGAALRKAKPHPDAELVARLGVVGRGRQARRLAARATAVCPVVVWPGDGADQASGQFAEELARLAQKRGLSAAETQARGQRLRVAAGVEMLADCDLVVIEPDDQADLAQNLAAVATAAPRAVLAVLDQAPPASGPSAERGVGLALMEPPLAAPLVELFPAQAADQAVQTAVAFFHGLGKAVVLSKAEAGPLAALLRAAYVGEGVLLAGQGASPQAVDQAMLDWGFAWGPLELRRRMAAGLALPAAGPGPAPADAAQRVALLLANLAAKAVDQGLAAQEVEVLAVHGLGFPAWRGGPLHLVDEMGPAQAVARLTALAREQGKRFAPAPPLVRMAEAGQKFFA